MSDRLLDTVVHPTAALFPLIEGPAFDELVEDIRQHGQLIPVVRHEGKLIDGRNRWRACRAAGIEPVEIDWKPAPGVTVSEWIISTNAVRRHMTVDQINVCTAEAMKYVREERAAARAKTQFKPGNDESAKGGLAKAGKLPADTISYPPAEKPDTKEKNARSTVGQVAAAAGTSHHKAAQAVALVNAAEKSPEAAKVLEQVKAGSVKLKDAVKAVKPGRSSLASAPKVKDALAALSEASGQEVEAIEPEVLDTADGKLGNRGGIEVVVRLDHGRPVLEEVRPAPVPSYYYPRLTMILGTQRELHDMVNGLPIKAHWVRLRREALERAKQAGIAP